MGYKKEVVYSVTEPQMPACQKTIGICINEQLMCENVMKCDRCRNYFKCTFKGAPCHIISFFSQRYKNSFTRCGDKVVIATNEQFFENTQRFVQNFLNKMVHKSR